MNFIPKPQHLNPTPLNPTPLNPLNPHFAFHPRSVWCQPEVAALWQWQCRTHPAAAPKTRVSKVFGTGCPCITMFSSGLFHRRFKQPVAAWRDVMTLSVERGMDGNSQQNSTLEWSNSGPRLLMALQDAVRVEFIRTLRVDT